MISMNFKSYASLVIFFIILVLFRFVLEHETIWARAFLSSIGIGSTRSPSVAYKNANSLYYFPYYGNYLAKSFDKII